MNIIDIEKKKYELELEQCEILAKLEMSKRSAKNNMVGAIMSGVLSSLGVVGCALTTLIGGMTISTIVPLLLSAAGVGAIITFGSKSVASWNEFEIAQKVNKTVISNLIVNPNLCSKLGMNKKTDPLSFTLCRVCNFTYVPESQKEDVVLANGNSHYGTVQKDFEDTHNLYAFTVDGSLKGMLDFVSSDVTIKHDIDGKPGFERIDPVATTYSVACLVGDDAYDEYLESLPEEYAELVDENYGKIRTAHTRTRRSR